MLKLTKEIKKYPSQASKLIFNSDFSIQKPNLQWKLNSCIHEMFDQENKCFK